MRKKRVPLIIFCVLCMAGLLSLQVYWIQKYYGVTQINFGKEINLAFEEAVEKEFSLRCDTVEKLMVKKLMDTTEFVVSSKLSKTGENIYTFRNKKDLKDQFSSSMSFTKINIPIIPGDTVSKKRVVERLAKSIRKTDLEDNVIFFRTQNLGKYLSIYVDKFSFDTLRLKPVFNLALKARGISTPYRFYLSHKQQLKVADLGPRFRDYPFITRSYITMKQIGEEQYVAALFAAPFSYIMANMALIFAASLLLLMLIGGCLIYLLKTLFREKRLSAVKNDFISNLTHEFKTPIATVSAAVEALTSFDVLNDKEKTQRYLGHAQTELTRLSGLVDQVLNMAIYSNNGTELVKEPVKLTHVVNELIANHSLQTGKNIRFHYEHKDLQYTVLADKVQFYHSINNVIDNAVKYSGTEVDITIHSEMKNNFLLISIVDTGAGISGTDLPMVFNQFYRSPEMIEKRVKGYGLGLNYVQSIMENHKGWCKIESELGKGSKVTLAWPV